MSDYKFAIEDYTAAYIEAAPLMKMHWEEIAKNKALLHLNPDEEFYAGFRKNVLIVTARLNGELVGYFVWFIIKHPHYKHVLTAEEDIHFLHPDHRKGMTGYMLMRAARDFAITVGAQLLAVREKIGHEHPAILERLGFKATDIVYTQGVA
jgi:GNAT superfamily N-acetyltransferase